MSWIITGSEKYETDPYRSQVSLLLHGDGTNGSTTIVDSSPSPKTVTVQGNARISTAESKFGGSSIVAGSSPNFEWNGNVLRLPAGSDFAYGTGDFTVETWIYVTSFGTRLFWSQSVAFTNYFLCGISPAGVLTFTFAVTGGGTVVSGPAITTNSWNHYAAVRQNQSVTVYSNGIGGTPVSCTQDFNNTTFVPTIGGYSHSSGLFFAGYIDDLRITKGVARYTSNFTPPTAPFPDI